MNVSSHLRSLPQFIIFYADHCQISQTWNIVDHRSFALILVRGMAQDDGALGCYILNPYVNPAQLSSQVG